MVTRGRRKKSDVTVAPATNNTRVAKRRSSSEKTTAATASSSTTTKTTTTTRAVKKPKTEKTTYASTKRLNDDTSDFNKSRLDHTTPHFPEPVDDPNRGKCCTLCRYATGGKKYRTNLMGCNRCNVILCVWCFKLFHTVPSLSVVKDDICKEIVKRMDGKKEERAARANNKGKQGGI